MNKVAVIGYFVYELDYLDGQIVMDKESDGDRMKKILVLVAGYPNNEGSVS